MWNRDQNKGKEKDENISDEKIKDALNGFLSDPVKANFFFDHFDEFYNTTEKNIQEAQNLLNLLKSYSSSQSQQTFAFLENILQMQKHNVQNFKLIFYILKALSNQKTQSTQQQPEKILSDEDRRNLEWLKKSFKHSKGDVSNSGI